MKRRNILISFTIEEVEVILGWFSLPENPDESKRPMENDLFKRFEHAKEMALKRQNKNQTE